MSKKRWPPDPLRVLIATAILFLIEIERTSVSFATIVLLCW